MKISRLMGCWFLLVTTALADAVPRGKTTSSLLSQSKPVLCNYKEPLQRANLRTESLNLILIIVIQSGTIKSYPDSLLKNLADQMISEVKQ